MRSPEVAKREGWRPSGNSTALHGSHVHPLQKLRDGLRVIAARDESMPKNIIVCTDGTWNHPAADDVASQDFTPADTNVL
jgi:hypothetical protein